ncbi:MAG: redoxin domain-containing protein [Chloroflexota bacterium]|nr:redoxin domain-containing protein [Chloroflexota bacterium]
MVAEFAAANAQVFGISVDSIHCHAAFARQREISFPLLSDFNKAVSRDYGVLIDLGTWMNVSGRAVFVVGRDGTIRYAWHGAPGDLPDVEQVLTEARAAGS